jgi:CheY-like chemotaxis protein
VTDFAQETLRILILDDDAVVRRSITHMVSAERFDPLEFGEGPAGPEGLALALGQPWDLIIVRKGLSMLDELKQMRPDQPILVLTVHALEGQVKVESNPDDLASAVRRILARGRKLE